MASNQDMLVRDMGHLQINNYSQYSQNQNNKKVAPVVPPKPKSDNMYATVTPKSNGMFEPSLHLPPQPASVIPQSSVGDPIYSNYLADEDLPPPPPLPPSQVTSYPSVQPQYQSGQPQYPPGQPQYPQGQPQYPQGQLQYPQGQPQYPQGQPQYPQGQPQYPQGQPQYPQGQPQYPQEQPQYPQEQPQYPPTSQQYPLPPPSDSSPASSTYGTPPGYASCRPNSSASSYDASSIYEPITPRPPSQMSNRSNYSIGSGSSSLYSSYYPASTRGKSTTGRPVGKEAEVDRLTDLMVQNMENPEFYGMCYKCGEKVLGEGSGCTAMDHMYHISCFTCHICYKELRGKTFYAKDGKPFCEEDYLTTLEKCCVCSGRILDRILRATGKPYHPSCFTCVVCGKCLDGIPFTVDATNQIYCIDDFHKKFAPRCCVCMQPIMPEHGKEETVRVVALDRSFHVQCYRCEDCGLRLSSEAEGSCYPLDDHILCRSCNAKRVQVLTSCMTTEL